MTRARLAVLVAVWSVCGVPFAQLPGTQLPASSPSGGRQSITDRAPGLRRSGGVKETITFESLARGTVVTQVFGDLGSGPVLVQGQNPSLGAANAAVVFDSSFPTGGDPDLGSPNVDFGGPGIGAGGAAGSPFANTTALGKILIVAEDLFDANGDLLVDDPDDADIAGSTLELDFAAIAPVELRQLTLIDIEDDRPPSTVELLDGAGGSLGVFALPQPGDNGVATVPLGPTSGVHRMVIRLNGSGGYDDLCFVREADCDGDGIPDGAEPDCDADGLPDDCEPDCNANGTPDDCESGPDCDGNGIPDDCQPDCDADGLPDACEPDCNANGTPDDCESGPDCDGNGIPDDCQPDCDADGLPDDCEPDCNANGTPDDCESGNDCDANGIPDDCEIGPDCNGDGVLDVCQLDGNDCNQNGIPDECDPDCDANGIPDDCVAFDDCNGDGIPDACQADGNDCDGNGVPDECDPDCDADGLPDGCETDADGDGVPDDCEVCTGAIGDLVWYDVDRDGLQDPSEPGIEGVVLVLSDAGGAILGTATTDRQGRYRFPDLCAGAYTVSVDGSTVPAGYFPTGCDVGSDDGLDNDCSPASTVLTADDDEDLTLDFGYQAPCTGIVGDLVWLDLDHDGLQDAGEPGIEGVRLNLLDPGGALLASVTTDGFGFYSFLGLCAGDYVVTVDPSTLPPGVVPTLCDAGADDALDNDCSPEPVTLPTSDSTDLTIDFGYEVPCTGSIGDFVWEDADQDGLQDAGELGIESVTLRLLDAAGDVIATTTTDGNGAYEFTGLCAGLYTVVVEAGTLPPGYVPTLCNVPPDDALDNDCSPATVVLPFDGATDDTVDFGYVAPPPGGGEGCTPGYWKQTQHFDSWPAGILPDMLFADFFEDAFPGKTLVEVLDLGGGGLNALGRHTVAAFLNASSPGVDYDVTASDVVFLFNDLFPASTAEYNALKSWFEAFNEQDCPLN